MANSDKPTPAVVIGLAVLLTNKLNELVEDTAPFEHSNDLSLQRDVVALCDELSKTLKKVVND
jgi:hypothetical protein